ncbi:hypothetical protein DXX93_04745 [Thalassotalea euphylliae]|uniref:PH domain-containing protein n=1 Tax=Thalassotalea euphylliae TaxID=1655234 RepID=A0A3E0TPM9_9GAMM|nr:hypothetical protein [Thalassotalea euphylliae]REL25935.1 hypothetical protein DXX93_04745 [Thalassotalea euphylliae]
MKVIEKKDLLIVSSYPYKVAVTCLLFIFGTLYISQFQPLSFNALSIGFVVPSLLLLVLDFKLSIFDLTNQQLLISQFSIKGKRRTLLAFDDIVQIRANSGNGYANHNGVVGVIAHNQFYALTALTDSNRKQQRVLANKLQTLIANG